MLAYDQPITRSKPDARPKPAQRTAGLNVLQVAQLLWRRKTAIVFAALIGACAAVAIGKGLTPKYIATAQLYVDPRELQLVDRELTPRSQDISGLAMVVDSQARVITSNSVLMQVIQDTHLDIDPEFGGGANGGLAKLLSLFGLQLRSAAPTTLGLTAALDALIHHIIVKKTDRTFIVDIDVWSSDPAKAAMLANAISNAYLAEAKNSQSVAARRATHDLSGRLKELQDRLRTAENALAIYKAQNNFVGTQDTLITDQQLLASNQRLAAARAATLDAQAKYDQIEASRRNAGDAGAIPEALQSPTLGNLRAQSAEARRKLAEMTAAFGPLHPSLRQMEKQVEDLHRTINEEVDRFAQSAKNDLARARDYETSLARSLEAQKRQSVQLSHASVRLRELERDVDAGREVYQSFLKRSRETEEQESLNTSNARIIGEATIPRRRSFPPPMSILAAIGLVLGGLAAASWFAGVELLSSEMAEQPPYEEVRPLPEAETPALQPKTAEAKPPSPVAEKPGIARLQETDVIRTLGGILADSGPPDLTRLGWPTLRATLSLTTFLNSMRDMREALARRSAANVAPVMAVIGQGLGRDRSIVTLNVALAAARNGARVLMIDADPERRALSNKLAGPAKPEAKRLAWLSIGGKAERAIKTRNGIEVLPTIGPGAIGAIRKTIAQARASADYDLVIIDGPALPFSAEGRKLIDVADGLIAMLSANFDINGCMDDIIAGLGGAEHKLVGVIINELRSVPAQPVRSAAYA
ncbi:exopolysaccharide transport family protein [Bradyrhizobium sp.]|uniref:exopolysaccharide transport family protein n=1 Tax=Bradyrhizobium sp. TaxID=376 RepID=UPI0026086A23|nr:exopolysaccharide transport family protein [Bradyrhizobium sp.]